jgi:NADPH:quinone reductase-like Zn-dependent oxidoreductase
MRAVVGRTYGSPDLLRLDSINRPAVGDGEVLVRVHAAGLDQGVWHTVTGLPYGVRAAGFGLLRPKTPVPGCDVAGVVESVGSAVTRFRVGDEVFGTCAGSFAEYASTAQDRLALKPTTMSFEQAAAVPTSGFAALQALRDVGKVQAGQHVLVIGAGGGVGTFAVQLAKAFGAEVTGVCSTSKVDLVRSLGADHMIDYTVEDFPDRPDGYDVIIDTGGDRSLAHLRKALTPPGTLVIVGGEGGGQLLGLSRQLRAMTLSPLVRHTLAVIFSSPRRGDLGFLTELLAAGELVPAVDRTFPLSEVPEAVRYMRAGRARGKVVITV